MVSTADLESLALLGKGSRVRHVLTRADTADKVSLSELRAASTFAAAVAARVCADVSMTFRAVSEGSAP